MTDAKANDMAFPSTFHNGWGEPEKGMTLRDYFAIHASEEDIQRHMTGLERVIVGQDGSGPIYRTEQVFRSREVARYRWADEMLKARQS